jgi:O-methyltransferase involved in polyketide biosynthesis
MLWPLWKRAVETERSDRLIDDPMATELAALIDYDFAASFRKPTVFHPIRARVSDDMIRDYLTREAEPVVIALGEGLETQRWRVGAERVRWITVDVPEAIERRHALLPSEERSVSVAGSALEEDWLEQIPAGSRPFVTAAGLLMYFTEDEVRALLERIARRAPGAEVFFDTIPPHISRKTLSGWKLTPTYTAPPMPWGVSIDDLPGFVASIPDLEAVSVQSYADPFPERTRLYRALSLIPPIRRRYAGGLVLARAAP